ncbi:MAG: hypothetical protein RBR53_03450 [Desulforegulaceae bacterium]|nr:hypothetical protein [Desulforegulaceae bacterium]
MKRIKIIFLFLVLFVGFSSNVFSKNVHPINLKLIKHGYLKAVPKYYPEVPRIPANTALNLYNSNQALFILVSYHNKDLIPGAFHFTEGQIAKINPNKLPLKNKKCLIVY